MSNVSSIALQPARRIAANPTLVRVLALGLLCLGGIRLLSSISFEIFHNDFSHYYIGGTLLAEGLNAYREPLREHSQAFGVAYDPRIPYAAHPPLILSCFSLLSRFPMPAAYGLWLMCQLAALLGSIEIARRIVGFSWRDNLWLAGIAVFVSSTCVESLIYYSQVQMIVALPILLAVLASIRGRKAWACALITLASAIKIYPVVLAPWFFLRGPATWSESLRRFAAGGAMALLCIVIPGPQAWIDFATLAVPELNKHAMQWGNYSLQNFVMLVAHTIYADTVLDWALTSFSFLASLPSLMAVAVGYLLAYRLKMDNVAAIALLVIAAATTGIICWSHYFTLLLLPLAVLWRYAIGSSSSRYQIAAMAVTLVVANPQLDLLVWGAVDSNLRFLLHFSPLLAAGMLAVMILRGHHSREHTCLGP